MGVSLEKEPGRRGTRGSDPLDHDPAPQIRSRRDLILRVGCGSGGPGSFARGGGGAGRRSSFSAVAGCQTSPDFIEFDAPRVILTKVWVRGARRGTRNPPEHSSGLGGALRCGCTGGGWSARRDSPACVFTVTP